MLAISGAGVEVGPRPIPPLDRSNVVSGAAVGVRLANRHGVCVCATHPRSIESLTEGP